MAVIKWKEGIYNKEYENKLVHDFFINSSLKSVNFLPNLPGFPIILAVYFSLFHIVFNLENG